MKKILFFLPVLLLFACKTVPQGRSVERKPALTDQQTADRIEGYKGNVFYIVRPLGEKLKAVSSSQFGLSTTSADNSEALRAALLYCQENPGTRLLVEKGEYHFAQTSPIRLEGLQNVLIEGPEAKFVTGKMGTFLNIQDCHALEIKGLTFEWERETDPIDDIVRICQVDKPNRSFDIEFPFREEVDEKMKIKALTQCDPETFTFGAKGMSQEVYYIMSPILESVEKIAPNVLRVHQTVEPGFSEGITAILRHHVYDGTAISLGGKSSSVTFQGLRFYGTPGMAIVAVEKSNHFQILDTYVGVDPALKDRHHVSLGADAFHFVNTNGCIRMEGCDVSGQGDDAVNIHDGLGYLYEVEGRKAKMYASAFLADKGDTLAFKSPGYEDMDFKAAIEDVKVEGSRKEILFDRDISAQITAGCTAWNTSYDSKNYVVRKNYFHENRARGLLLQSSEGVCEENRFYKIEGPAIRVVMDIIPSLWQEGTGVDGLTIRNNTFENCDYSRWGIQIEISTNIDNHRAETVVFRNIDILDNRFSASESCVLNAANVDNLLFSGNEIEALAPSNALRFGDYCGNMKFKSNTFTGEYASAVEESIPATGK